jgi:hypothetical protein
VLAVEQRKTAGCALSSKPNARKEEMEKPNNNAVRDELASSLTTSLISKLCSEAVNKINPFAS